MPEHQEQQATVAGLVPAAPGRLDQPFNLAAGEVLAVAVIPAHVSAFASVHRFVESLACAMPRKPAPNGQGAFRLSTKGFILSRGSTGGRAYISAHRS